MKNNPYIGPRPYERQDCHSFFGRAREARTLLALAKAERVVLFYAQSGAGKTSLLNAQIIPALEEEGFHVLPVARVWDRTAADPSAYSIILPGHTGPVWSVAFSPASQPLRVATGSGDNTARLWQPVTLTEVADLACLRAGRNLTADEWKLFMGDAPTRKTCPALP